MDNQFNNGKLYLNGECIDVASLPWNEHPAYKGVFLKHVITGNRTDNRLSCHLVKIEPTCEIGLHNHAGKTELHEVLNGNGHCILEDKKMDYRKGVTGLIPADMNHLVKASSEGLFLLAKFFPALV